jgi:SAM-dependent methyltransferase
LLAWALKKYLPHSRNLLEIGCGTGFVLQGLQRAFPSLRLTASEIFCEGLRVAAQRVPQASLLQMDALHMPFREEFDVIGAFDVLEHIEDDETVLRQMYVAAKKGGGVMITVPQHPWLWSEIDRLSGHVRRYSGPELKDKAERAGFRVLRMTSFVAILLPLMVIVRLLKKRGSEDFLAEYDISRFSNLFLERLLDLEAALIRLGVSLRSGGSLLLVAERPGV